MKKQYTFLLLILISTITFSQTYQFGIENIAGYNFKIIAVPSANSSGDTDILDAGFTLMLPAGNADVASQVGLLDGRAWDVQEFDAAFLTGLGLGDGTKDAFQFNLPAGQTLLTHNTDPIDLVSFDITNMPTSGEMSILLNSDPIATGAGGVLDSFYNVDLDGPGGNPTGDFFAGLAPGLESFNFSTLSIDDSVLTNSTISIYPNPASKHINISGTGDFNRVELYNILGEQILSSHKTNQLSVEALPSGVYMLKIIGTTGSLTKKIIKE